MKICNDDDPDFLTKLVKFDISAEGIANDMMAPANHHMVKKRGFYAEPVHSNHTAVWSVDFCPLGKKQKEFSNDSFIDHENLMNCFLNGGALKLHVDASIKTVEIVNNFK